MLFLVVIFLLKNTSAFKNTVSFVQGKQEGLTYNTATVGDLVAKDSNGNGIPDWEEALYGLDPTKKETVPGIPNSTTINKLKGEQELSASTINGSASNTENLTQTDKFSQQLFATVASLDQNGTINQAAADQIASSLTDQIKNYAPKKVFSLSDIKIDSSQNIKNYSSTFLNIFGKNKMPDGTVTDVLQNFAGDETNIDETALQGLDPFIGQTNKIIVALAQMKVPQSLASLHVDFLNGLERVSENLSDIRLYDTDPVVAMAGISQYENNSALFVSARTNLSNALKKLNN